MTWDDISRAIEIAEQTVQRADNARLDAALALAIALKQYGKVRPDLYREFVGADRLYNAALVVHQEALQRRRFADSLRAFTVVQSRRSA